MDLNEVDLEKLNNTVIELPHPFETELYCLVNANHQIALAGIDQKEQEMMKYLNDSFRGEDLDVWRSIELQHRNFCDDLRRSLRSLPLVGIVTRFGHWISRLALQISPSNTRETGLVTKLGSLKGRFGEGPVKHEFFSDLITVRDAIIHNDSIAGWVYKGKTRQVADRYVQHDEVYISDDDLTEAVQKAADLVKWYDEKLNPLKSLS